MQSFRCFMIDMAELRAMTLVIGTSSVISLNYSRFGLWSALQITMLWPCQTYTRFCGAALITWTQYSLYTLPSDCCESTILWGWSHSVTRFVSNTPSKGTYQLVIYSKKQEHIQIHKSILNIIPVLPHSLIFLRGRGHTPVSISLTYHYPRIGWEMFAGSTFWISIDLVWFSGFSMDLVWFSMIYYRYRYLVTRGGKKWNPVESCGSSLNPSSEDWVRRQKRRMERKWRRVVQRAVKTNCWWFYRKKWVISHELLW